ncbi:glycoside hydrolase family 35 protein [Frondihabitans cladoniiphilus]|uniref:Beta-galactosidase n=1 Tax=Frondihabitans cladoniiphilus TaxID=715785 RepID=A0ABP8VKC5_9MICO
MTSRFLVGDDTFLFDGAPHRVLSGALHYFRVHPDLWADRIHKARLLGLNTIETYVPWGDHEPQPGEWSATGGLDLGRFLDLVQAEGMHAIVRPGPYICAEWDNGGLPGWLFARGDTGIRRFEPHFMKAVEAYLQRVYEIVAPRQIDLGGPVVLVQIENEYGAYGDDKEYLRALVDLTREAGITVPLTSVDQPEPYMLENGSLPELLRTGSFGSRSRERLAVLREHQPTGPLMCSEYWNGWFDHWGDAHHVTPADEQARDLDELLALGASVNLYMFHGGTNFGLTNGANDKGVYEPTVTSYDYDAPLDEAGNPTAKFFAFREVFGKYTELPPFDLDRAPEEAPTPRVEPEAGADLLPLLDRLGDWTPGSAPAPALFDDLGHYRGFLALRARLDGRSGDLHVAEVRDRALVFVDGDLVGVLERSLGDTTLVLPAGDHLTVLVEDQGRVNYDLRLGEPKGLIGPVTVGGAALDWSAMALDLDRLADLPLSRVVTAATGGDSGSGPSVLRFSFALDEPADLFLDTRGAGKGIAYLNGFALGRYWSRGPQQTLYVPGPVTRAGENEILLLELESRDVSLSFSPSPRLGDVVIDGRAVHGV